MRCACIDVGSNTTRLLVADARPRGLKRVRNDRSFTLIGRSLGASDTIPRTKIDETAAVVADQADAARALGAERIRVVATAAIRRAANARELAEAVAARTGLTMDVLEGEEEARLAYRGAADAVGAVDTLAVIDVGGGSTEIAVGEGASHLIHAQSVPIGSSVLAERHLRTDPPTPAELDSVRAETTRTFEGFEPPAVDRAVAVGGSARSLLHMAGRKLGVAELGRALAMLSSAPADAIAARFGLDPIRVRLLPAGAIVLTELAQRLGQPLEICRGGLREGVILEMAAGPR